MQGFGDRADNILNLLYSGSEENAKLAATIAEGLHIPIKKLLKTAGWNELGFNNIRDFYQKKIIRLEYSNLNSTEQLVKAAIIEKMYLNNSKIDTFVGFDNLYNLSYLDISNSKINNFPTSSILNLRELWAGNLSVDMSQKIKFVANLIHLNCLSFNNNELKNSDFLENLSQLEFLFLQNNELKAINGLQKMSQLKRLDLSGNKIKELELSHFGQLKDLCVDNNQLQNLHISACNLSLLTAPSNKLNNIDLGLQTNLARVELASNKIQKFELENKFFLNKINLGDNQLKELYLSNLPQLRELNIGYNPLKIIALANLPKIEIIRLSRDMENTPIHKELKKQVAQAKILF